MNAPDPFPLDKSRVRRVHPISAEQLAKIMRETGAPHPNAGEYNAPLAFNILGWGCLAIAAVTYAVLVLAR